MGAWIKENEELFLILCLLFIMLAVIIAAVTDDVLTTPHTTVEIIKHVC